MCAHRAHFRWCEESVLGGRGGDAPQNQQSKGAGRGRSCDDKMRVNVLRLHSTPAGFSLVLGGARDGWRRTCHHYQRRANLTANDHPCEGLIAPWAPFTPPTGTWWIAPTARRRMVSINYIYFYLFYYSNHVDAHSYIKLVEPHKRRKIRCLNFKLCVFSILNALYQHKTQLKFFNYDLENCNYFYWNYTWWAWVRAWLSLLFKNMVFQTIEFKCVKGHG